MLIRNECSGNLVIYGPYGPCWASDTDNRGQGPFKAIMQGDGNFVLYDTNGTPTWASNTCGMGPGLRVFLQDDGRMMLMEGEETRWASQNR